MTQNSKSPIMGTYGRFQISLVKGKGSEVFDSEGKRYLDFVGGISVLPLGHAPEKPLKALIDQAQNLWHVSNLFRIPPQEALAQKLIDNTCFDQVYFCNSGTESVECALKLARLASTKIHGSKRKAFVSMNNSFHGRTMGSLSVTGQEAYREPFDPMVTEVRFADFGDLKSLETVLDNEVAAVIMEPLQAEGGLHTAPEGYLQAVRKLCDEHGVLLIFDEVQVGIGRLGKLFAYQIYDVEPDIMTLAKGLGGGFPVGATLAKEAVSQYLVAGTHGSTFGGNPLATATALAVLEALEEDDVIAKSQPKAKIISDFMNKACSEIDEIQAVKGMGMLQGLKFDREVAPLANLAVEAGLLVGFAGKDIIRIAPALNIPENELKEGLEILRNCIEKFIK